MKKQILLSFIIACFMNFADAQWKQTGPYTSNIGCIAVSANTIIAGTNYGVYLTTNNGGIWKAINTGLLDSTHVQALVIDGQNIFAGTWLAGMYMSSDNGNSWKPVNTGLPANVSVSALAISGDSIFAGTSYSGIYLSTNNGSSWVERDSGIANLDINILTTSAGNIIAGTMSGVYYLTSGSKTSLWNQMGNIASTNVISLAVNNDTIFAGTDIGGIFFSTDTGSNWKAIDSGLPEINNPPFTSSYTSIKALAISDGNVFAGIDSGLYISVNKGSSWTPVKNIPTSTGINALAVSKGYIFAGINYGMYISSDSGNNWNLENTGMKVPQINTIAVEGGNIYAGTNAGVFLSVTRGSTWLPINTGLTTTNIYSFAFNQGNVYSGTDFGVFLSVNNGNNWSAASKGLPFDFVNALAVNGKYIFAGTVGNGIYISTNNGSQWDTTTNNGFPKNDRVASIVTSGNNIFAGTWFSGVYLSSNNGGNWEKVNNGLANIQVNALAVSGENIIAATNGGVFTSSNNGGIWNNIDSIYSSIFSIGVDKNSVFVGTDESIYMTSDSGKIIYDISGGLPSTFINCIAFDSTYVYVGINGGVWELPISELIPYINAINVIKNSESNFEVYPNPATDKINIDLQNFNSSQNNVLSIYNIQGQPILQQTIQASKTEIDISNFTKGVYILKLNNGSYTEVKKLLKD